MQDLCIAAVTSVNRGGEKTVCCNHWKISLSKFHANAQCSFSLQHLELILLNVPSSISVEQFHYIDYRLLQMLTEWPTEFVLDSAQDPPCYTTK